MIARRIEVASAPRVAPRAQEGDAGPAFNSSLGRAGAFGASGIATSPIFCSNDGTSGSGAALTFLTRRSRGRNFASASSLICKRGFAGPGNLWNCTILGKFGSSLGGSKGALGLISV